MCSVDRGKLRGLRSPDPFSALPDELLLKVLMCVGSQGDTDMPRCVCCASPFIEDEPHPGLRAHPFLAQVCRRWKALLDSPWSRAALWRDVVVDFGHELITAVHRPIVWADKRPSDSEFREAFSGVKLSAARMVRFVAERQHSVRRLVLLNSEGYWTDESEFVNLQFKHNFTLGHLGLLLGLLRGRLEELHVANCNDFFQLQAGALAVVSLCPHLRVLRLERVSGLVDAPRLADIAHLTNLEELCVSGEESTAAWTVGMTHVPPAWAGLTRLRALTLRGHSNLHALPEFLTGLRELTRLEVPGCSSACLRVLPRLTQLQALSLKGLKLVYPERGALGGRRPLPDLRPLARLTCLSLCANALAEPPPALTALSALQLLDLAHNRELKITRPLALAALPALRFVDFRHIHSERALGYWSDAKCRTMSHVARLAKALRRRPFPTRVLVSTEQ